MRAPAQFIRGDADIGFGPAESPEALMDEQNPHTGFPSGLRLSARSLPSDLRAPNTHK